MDLLQNLRKVQSCLIDLFDKETLTVSPAMNTFLPGSLLCPRTFRNVESPSAPLLLEIDDTQSILVLNSSFSFCHLHGFFIILSVSLLSLAKKKLPDLPIVQSTQDVITNSISDAYLEKILSLICIETRLTGMNTLASSTFSSADQSITWHGAFPILP